ncbi:FAD binding domain-containing protein [Treponema sp. OMZ 840]|uniref:FAD binding domain-containing protein n=1 Tax=Treponema sp. OMZ 840 TaxID=244313 RepID=UPI003D8EB9A4
MDYVKPDTFFVSNLTDALQQLKNIPSLTVLAGCTSCIKSLNGTKIRLPPAALFIRHIEELQTVDKKERFIGFGAAVSLNRILELGKKRIPDFLYDAVSSVASHNIRNLATIGGNICKADHKMSLYAPLLAMDARLEFKSITETVQIPMSKFSEVPQGFLLTKVLIPMQDWSVTAFNRLGPSYEINHLSVSFTFLADTTKGILGDMRAAFCGPVSIRSHELENSIIGSRLPLNERDIENLLSSASRLYDDELIRQNKDCAPLLKNQYMNLLQYSLKTLM